MRGLVIFAALCNLVASSSVRECEVSTIIRNELITFDGVAQEFDEHLKYLLSSFPGSSSTDQCKFQIRMDTGQYGEDETGVLKWTGIAFGVHQKNPDKFERNFRVSREQGVVELRGRGLKTINIETVVRRGKPVPVTAGSYQTEPSPLDWVFTYSDNQEDGTMDFEMSVPDLGCHVYVSYQEAGTGPSPLDYDSMVITTDDYYNGQLLGYCGDADGDPANDDQFCPGNAGNVAIDCIDGAHQGNPGP